MCKRFFCLICDTNCFFSDDVVRTISQLFYVLKITMSWRIICHKCYIIDFFVHVSRSFCQSTNTVNKGQSMVNYCQSLAFHCRYLSYNDHSDQWLFHKILFYYYFQKQLYTDVLQNRCYGKFCNIHRKTSVLESLFNKASGRQLYLNLIPKETSTQVFSCENYKIFMSSIFYTVPPLPVFVSLIK